jgi:hypothetical protein
VKERLLEHIRWALTEHMHMASIDSRVKKYQYAPLAKFCKDQAVGVLTMSMCVLKHEDKHKGGHRCTAC